MPFARSIRPAGAFGAPIALDAVREADRAETAALRQLQAARMQLDKAEVGYRLALEEKRAALQAALANGGEDLDTLRVVAVFYGVGVLPPVPAECEP